MSRQEKFDLGDRVAYVNFKTPVYGTIIHVSIELPKVRPDVEEVRVYTIAMDEGGIFTGLSRHLRRAENEL